MASKTGLYPEGTWFPDLTLDLCDLAQQDWDSTPVDSDDYYRFNDHYGCNSPGLRGRAGLSAIRFYVCPGHVDNNWRRRCGRAQDYFCAAWGCETTGHIWWTKPRTGDLITVTRTSNPVNSCPGTCNTIKISFTDRGKKTNGWELGKMWGLRLYMSGHDDGVLFTIRLQVQRWQPPKLMGPNQTKL